MSRASIQLEQIRVREPCTADWDRMSGDDRVRFCEGCQSHVHNLSAMTRDEAERLVCEAAGRLCVCKRAVESALETTLVLHRNEPSSHRPRFLLGRRAVLSR